MEISEQDAETVRQGQLEGRQPLYLSVYGLLRDEIQVGRWKVGASLPSEAALSDRFQVSRITTRHALRLLEADGYIRKAQSRRPVVTAAAPPRREGWFMESLADIVAMVGDARLDIQSWQLERSAPDARDFGLPLATRLHCLRGILSRNGRPYARSIIYFRPEVGSRLPRGAFNDAVVFRVLQRELGIHIEDVRMIVWAELASEEDARDLGCEVGDAILATQLLYRDERASLIEIAYSRALASQARLSTRLVTSARDP
ncbi:GntR family transcriptional regulator [Microvirga puerhi]|uniref:GntR family transcriptional regulator n=1 Tax=Microvirga puerhi TaxID=2876078 RepID=A0ABS7VSD0_9HYPH|nr:GntR family transcriptional regulator [Microvirga puerhi]MBZ6078456.1 GntR family transcriptional regulator [Microvirga puerhi]